jgi:hypothetical protein
MDDRFITEGNYREAIRHFIEIIENETVNEEELYKLITLMEMYEYENC